MEDLVDRARVYATEAHQRINHRRKYSDQPYDSHLAAVAKLVASVTDDAETIAAAWLHDTVEDTEATLEDIEENFGHPVAELVEELTDISKPGDGNRATRKAIDRRHLAQASRRAKTVKLADLIHNCRDIVQHDYRFARVYLAEMGVLLEVLGDGDPDLYQRALRTHSSCLGKLGFYEGDLDTAPDGGTISALPGMSPNKIRRIFGEMLSASDIAEPLHSFDSATSSDEASDILGRHHREVAVVRIKGKVQGYVRRRDISGDDCASHIRHFTADQVIRADAYLSDVIHVLTRHDYCFVTMLSEVVGVITRNDINKPVARMWLFGIVTLVEITLVRLINENFPEDTWKPLLSKGRLEKAMQMQEERERRNQLCSLVDCLQFSDKARIVIEKQRLLEKMGFETRNAAKKVIRQLESLRNNLAHSQDIVSHDWAQIARLSRRIEAMAFDR